MSFRLNSHDPERKEQFSRRAMIFGGGLSVLFAGVGARLYHLQVREYETFSALALENQFNRRVLTPLRGEIVDRSGV